MCPHVCGGQEVRGHIGGLSGSPSYFETMSLTDSDRLAGQGGLPSALTTDALVGAFFFFNLDSGTQVPIHVHVTDQPISATRL